MYKNEVGVGDSLKACKKKNMIDSITKTDFGIPVLESNRYTYLENDRN